MPGRMKVQEVFRFSDGRVVFAGDIESAAAFVQRSRWKLFVDGEERAVVEIEGEMIPTPRKTTARSLSTTQNIDVDHLRAHLGAVELVEE